MRFTEPLSLCILLSTVIASPPSFTDIETLAIDGVNNVKHNSEAVMVEMIVVVERLRKSLPDIEVIFEQAVFVPSSDSSASELSLPTFSRGRFSAFGGALRRPWRNTRFAPEREHGVVMMSDESLSSEGISSYSPRHPQPRPHLQDGTHLPPPEPTFLRSLLKLLDIPSHHHRIHSDHNQALINPEPELDLSSWGSHGRPAAARDDSGNLDAALLGDLLHHSPLPSIENMRTGVPRRGPPVPPQGRHPHRHHHRHSPRFACRFRRFLREMKPLIMGFGWLKWIGLLVVLVGCVGRVSRARAEPIELNEEESDSNEKDFILAKDISPEEKV